MGSCDSVQVGHEPVSGVANELHLCSELSGELRLMQNSSETGHGELGNLDLANELDGDFPDGAGCGATASEKGVSVSCRDGMGGERQPDCVSGLNSLGSEDSTGFVNGICSTYDICELGTDGFCFAKQESVEDNRLCFHDMSEEMRKMQELVQVGNCNVPKSNVIDTAPCIENSVNDGTAFQQDKPRNDMQERIDLFATPDDTCDQVLLFDKCKLPLPKQPKHNKDLNVASLPPASRSAEKSNDDLICNASIVNSFISSYNCEETADLKIQEAETIPNEVMCNDSSCRRIIIGSGVEDDKWDLASVQQAGKAEVEVESFCAPVCQQGSQNNDQAAKDACIHAGDDSKGKDTHDVVIHVKSSPSKIVQGLAFSSELAEKEGKLVNDCAGSPFYDIISNVVGHRSADVEADLCIKRAPGTGTGSGEFSCGCGYSPVHDTMDLNCKNNGNNLQINEEEGKDDTVTTVPEMIFPVTNFSYSRRKSSRKRSSQNDQSKKPGASGRRAGRTQKFQENFESIFNCCKGKRSLASKSVRSTEWGIRGVTEMFLHGNDLDSNHGLYPSTNKLLSLQWSKQDDRKGIKLITQETKGEMVVSTGLRLRVKFGKTGGPDPLKAVVPGSHTNSGTNVSGKSNSDTFNSVKPLETKNEETGILFKLSCDSSKRMTIPNSGNSSMAKKSNKYFEYDEELKGKPTNDSSEFCQKLAAENGYDAGTSPDSEVINAMPDSVNNGGNQTDQNPSDLSPFEAAFAAPAAPSNKKKVNGKSRKKDTGKKTNCLSKDSRVKQKKASSAAKAPTNICGEGELSSKPLALPEDAASGVSGAVLKVESGAEAKIHTNLGDKYSEIQSESGASGTTEMQGHQRSKSFKSGMKKGKSRSAKSSKNRKKDVFSDQKTERNPKKAGKEGKENDRVDHLALDPVENQWRASSVEHVVEDGVSIANNMGMESSSDPINKNVLQINGIGVEEQRTAWVRCDDCYKWRRIPAALADMIGGTCRWVCKDNLNKDFADCLIAQEMSNDEINKELGIPDADVDAYDGDASHKVVKGMRRKHGPGRKKACFRGIKINQFLHRHRKAQTIDEVMVCHCKPPATDGQWGCGNECLNRMLNIECIQGTCPCGDRCSNQQFQQRKYIKMQRFHSGKKGYGLKLLEDVMEGQFLIEYVGEVLDMQAYGARQKDYAANGQKHFYFMTLNGNEVIDAGAKGNLGRFINHSCEPNCRTEKWMVNGEICVGIFALRDIKKDEEVTFDYNYVRVFGAAAKKCYCGSLYCRGYIGGDPSNGDAVVESDSDEESSEPMMIEDDDTVDSVVDLVSETQVGKPTTSEDEKESSIATDTTDIENFKNNHTSAIPIVQSSMKLENSVSPILLPENLMAVEDITGRSTPVEARESTSRSLSPTQMLEDASGIVVKSASDSFNGDKNFEQSPVEKMILRKPSPLLKMSRSMTPGKKAKGSKSFDGSKVHAIVPCKSQLQAIKPKRLSDVSSSSQIETIEEKLNELLDSEGGISKRKDATKGYLKLLLLTAASRGLASSEAIQSNRDLSMILDALLKTKSRAVLVDIINKNGLQMLHNIMKQYRRDFKKIPILRKLLKVLEYLAVREILTLEHIVRGPPCLGMESFKDSILSLTEHDDKQVHQIARNFRDRWIPKHLRKIAYVNREEKMEFRKDSDSSRFSSLHGHWGNHGPTEPVKHATQRNGTLQERNAVLEVRSDSDVTPQNMGGTKIRKRKSRWDQPAPIRKKTEFADGKENGICQSDHKADTVGNGKEEQNPADDDAPPGFSSPVIRSSASFNAVITDVVVGQLQPKFNNRRSVSYGIPLNTIQQFGSPLPEAEGWVVAPAMPFCPFPPLPPLPRERKTSALREAADPVTDVQESDVSSNGSICITVVDRQDREGSHGANDSAVYKRKRESFCDLVTRYFRQQKFSVPQWVRRWGNAGSNFKPEVGRSGSVTNGSTDTSLSQKTSTE